ncbi:PREDICTED: uncharacterized protein LOC104603041 isoform X1 [Nelumbo nucifera]|uniref:Uncharacterized protein LOC104603041 isoform X1 n=1 Tax=Nelumbo nucifera TaxID=4432 RepID=A0A1U8AQN1_NELNU|nr:PREDICTED: uncharacterized protein LOC104603041 isoform X1 [Nelumbo nucifera]
MEDSGDILCQVSAFKDMLDQVNEEIEANIQTTREIESEIVKCDEIENEIATRESGLTKMIFAAEFEMSELIQVSAVARTSLEHLEKELSYLRMKREEVIKRVTDKWEAFIILCRKFQGDITKGEDDELWKLLSQKEVLENENYNLSMKVNALRNSMSAFVEVTLEELHNSNSALEVEIQHQNWENEKLLDDIEELKTSLLATSSSDNNICKHHPHASNNGSDIF